MEPAQSEQTTIGAAAALQTPEEHEAAGGTFAGGANLKGTLDGSIESSALEASTDYR